MNLDMTNKERLVMNLLMNSNRSLTASEITAIDESLNINTVQSVLRSLLKMGLIEVADIVYSGKVLCRSYRPSNAGKDYSVTEFAEQFNNLRQNVSIPYIFSALVEENINDSEVIKELEMIIQEQKRKLGQEGDE